MNDIPINNRDSFIAALREKRESLRKRSEDLKVDYDFVRGEMSGLEFAIIKAKESLHG